MIATLSDATTITISVIGFFALLALIALVRSVMTKRESSWRRIRVGLFVERDPSGTIDPARDDEARTD